MDLKDMLQKLIYGLDALAIFVIVWGSLAQFLSFLKKGLFVKDKSHLAQTITDVKNMLGSYILLALEILIGADIIETIINPSIDHIITLAVIVIIRTVISFFLSREISEAEEASSSNKPSSTSS